MVGIVDCKQTTLDHDSGERIPTARIRRIEPIDGDDEELAAKLMRRALERRMGETVLPFETEEDLTDLLESLVEDDDD
ncbi:MAG: hypothetical protein U5R31_03200 [Acidimicrobiia bacterium]|nr:hypothetical protein [Acidimicrobiia bacterium]